MTRGSRDVALPLFFYLAVTLAVPLVGNGYARAGFSEHAATLLVVATAFLAIRAVSRAAMRRRPTSVDM